jgi:hypothetical protein
VQSRRIGTNLVGPVREGGVPFRGCRGHVGGVLLTQMWSLILVDGPKTVGVGTLVLSYFTT